MDLKRGNACKHTRKGPRVWSSRRKRTVLMRQSCISRVMLSAFAPYEHFPEHRCEIVDLRELRVWPRCAGGWARGNAPQRSTISTNSCAKRRGSRPPAQLCGGGRAEQQSVQRACLAAFWAAHVGFRYGAALEEVATQPPHAPDSAAVAERSTVTRHWEVL